MVPEEYIACVFPALHMFLRPTFIHVSGGCCKLKMFNAFSMARKLSADSWNLAKYGHARTWRPAPVLTSRSSQLAPLGSGGMDMWVPIATEEAMLKLRDSHTRYVSHAYTPSCNANVSIV